MSLFLKERKNRILPVVLVSLALPVVLFVEVPLEVYVNNMEELAFSMRDFFPQCLWLWLGTALLAALVLFLLPEKLYRVACPLAAAGALLLFLQGTYLNFGGSALPGDNLSATGAPAWAAAVDCVVWALILGLAVWTAFYKKHDLVHPAAILFAVVVLGTQLVSTAFLLLSTDGVLLTKQERMLLEDPDYTPRVLGSDGLTELGSERNVLVFIVDRFDVNYAKTALERHPDVFDELTGFTWFQDAVSRYNHTYPSLPWMLTNKPYSIELKRREYLDPAYEGDIPLTRLHDAGYTVDLYTSDYYAFRDGAYLPDYVGNLTDAQLVSSVPLKNRMLTAVKMAQVSMYRCLPLPVKGVLGNIDSRLDKYYAGAAAAKNCYSTDLKSVYDQVKDTPFTLVDGKRYSFIHVEGCHSVPYDEDWQPAAVEIEEDYAVSVSTSFDIIDRYLQQMKLLGVYDDATIVITGDHPAAFGDGGVLQESRIVSLFVKPSGVGEGELKTSQAQVSHEDLWATIFRSEGLDGWQDYGRSVFDVSEDEDRVRHYGWHTWIRTGLGSVDEYDFEISGPGEDFSNWTIAGQQHQQRFLMD